MVYTTIEHFSVEELPLRTIFLTAEEFDEGDEKLVQHMKRERDSRATKMAKELFKSRNQGRLFCEICEFDFSEKYGDIGDGFIEAHHIKPISKMQHGDKTRIEDFVMVCSNCHSMLHTGISWITHESLRNRVLANKKEI